MPSYHIETYGCAANQADGEIIAGLLGAAGYAEVAEPRDADVLIVNTCGVKSPTEDKIVHRVRELSRLGKPIVLAGCLTLINWDRLASEATFGAAITPRSVHRVREAVEMASRDPSGKLLLDGDRTVDKPSLPYRPRRALIGTIEVEDGCNFACSFCATKFSRGRAYSYSADSIVGLAGRLVGSGAVELRLTGQDVAAYRHGDVDLRSLVSRISSEVAGDFRIRIGMMTPPLAHRMRHELVQAYMLDKVYKFAHLPVQSGSDRVLAAMRRGHDVGLYMDLVGYLRERLDGITIETDVIVGHPGEEEEDFELTLKLLRDLKPDVVNLSKYSNRPGTAASAMKQQPSQVIARRSREAHDVVVEVGEGGNSRWVGWEGRALVVEEGEKEGTLISRNDWYKPIVIRGGRDLLGRRIEVKVEGYEPTYLWARIIGGGI